MKKYTIALIILTIVLILVSFCTLWFGENIFQPILALMPLYFAVITGLMHYGVVKSFYKDPRTFVKNFLGITVGSLFLHLCVLFIWSLTHIKTAKIFIIGFCICYVAYLVFETVALILVVRNARNNQDALTNENDRIAQNARSNENDRISQDALTNENDRIAQDARTNENQGQDH